MCHLIVGFFLGRNNDLPMGFFTLHSRREAVELQSKLRHNGYHQHNSQKGWTNRIFVRSWMAIADHVGSSSVLVHAVNDKGNGNGQEQDSVELRKGILIFGKGQNGNARTRQGHAEVHPCQEGSLVGKKDFGFDLNGGFARLDHGSNVAYTLGRRRWHSAIAKHLGPKSASVGSRRRSGLIDNIIVGLDDILRGSGSISLMLRKTKERWNKYK